MSGDYRCLQVLQQRVASDWREARAVVATARAPKLRHSRRSGEPVTSDHELACGNTASQPARCADG